MGHESTIAALAALLAAEAEAARRGALADLAALAVRKTELVAALPASVGPALARDLAPIRAAAEANGRLLAAALSGVEAASARLAAIRAAIARLDSYDATGRATTVRFAAGSVERRA